MFVQALEYESVEGIAVGRDEEVEDVQYVDISSLQTQGFNTVPCQSKVTILQSKENPKTFSKCVINVLKMYIKCVQNVCKMFYKIMCLICVLNVYECVLNV